jgi:hypothetical protein
MNPFLEAARRLPGHWFQGDMYDGENACGIGHLSRVMNPEGNNLGDFYEAWNVLSAVAVEQYSDRIVEDNSMKDKFAKFNDHPDTTEDDVVAVMEKAAVLWDEQNG